MEEKEEMEFVYRGYSFLLSYKVIRAARKKVSAIVLDFG
ncbi:hypothetical protein QFZ48_006125 [Chitinophaga sp. W2I13]